MSLNYDEIKNSGLLELYVIGALEDTDRQRVEQALAESAELRSELKDIELTYERYARLNKVSAPTGLKDQILRELGEAGIPSTREADIRVSRRFNWAAVTTALLGLGMLFQYWSNNKSEARWEAERQILAERCDSAQVTMQGRLDRFELLLSEDNRIIPVNATDNYLETRLYFHTNPQEKRNFIQIQNLPPLADNQSFQLWSLKGDQAPIPLDVFDGSGDAIIPVEFIDETNAYAITIEPAGGSQTPTLERLIGVFNI